jgi:hypothetical protein
MTESAQEVFKRLLRDAVAPELRRQGLKGSGAAYVLPDTAFWAQVGFQKSTSNNSDFVKFTINLKVTGKEWWDEQRRAHSPLKDTPPLGVDKASWDAQRLEHSVYPARPSANVSGEGRIERIGRLIPGIEADHWWSLSANNAEGVMAEAVGALLSHGLPWLRREIQVKEVE